MDNVLLYEELKLIERDDADIHNAWKGVHLLLFFMAFVFGSFCTFSFHMLMYLFDKKCVLYPKLLWLTSLPHDIIYEFIPVDKEIVKMLPVDFVSTQWMEKSVCYLPTYVPLMSGIFGIIWTTMFLVCYTNSGTLEGSRRSWRVLIPIFIFSVAMSGLCIYSSTITHQGLEELCVKLGEITGSSTCTYTVNVATLAYERSIRGVYQAIQLTITSAWLHTSCWIMSAVLILVRVVLLVDFQLVRIKVELQGDLDKMLQHYEEQMRTVSPNVWMDEKLEPESQPERVAVPLSKSDIVQEQKSLTDNVKYHYKNSKYSETTFSFFDDDENFTFKLESEYENDIVYPEVKTSSNNFIQDIINEAIYSATEEVQHRVDLALSDFLVEKRYQGTLDSFVQQESEEIARRRRARRSSSSSILMETATDETEKIPGKQEYDTHPVAYIAPNIEDMPSTSKAIDSLESNVSSEKKSNLKHASTQSDSNIKPKPKTQKVHIKDPKIRWEKKNQTTQTPKKEKEE